VVVAEKQRFLFLINPRSGGPKGKQLLERLKRYAADDSSVKVDEISVLNSELVAEISRNGITLIIGGGDGTISSSLPMLVDSGVSIGILPLGTGNDLARELKVNPPINGSIEQLIDYYRALKPTELDLFEAQFDSSESMIFVNYLSVGYDALVLNSFASLREWRIFKWLRGKLLNRILYLLSAIIWWRANYSFFISSNADRTACRNVSGILFTNLRSIMGIGLSNNRSLPGDSILECLVIAKPLNYISMIFPSLFFLPRVVCLGSSNCWSLEVEDGSSCSVQIDGEAMPLTIKSLVVRMHKKVQLLAGN